MQPNPAPPAAAPPEPSQALNNLVASLVLAQAAAKLNQQHQQLQSGAPAAMPAAVPSPPPVANNVASSGPSMKLPGFNFPAPINGGASVAPQQVLQAREQQSQPETVAAASQKIQVQATTPPPEQAKSLTKEERLKAAFEEQQRALRLAYEKSLREAQEEDRMSQATPEVQKPEPKKVASKPLPVAASNQKSSKPLTAAELLQRSYEAHLASLQKSNQEAAAATSVPPQPVATKPKPAADSANNQGAKANGKKQQGKTKDEEAGTILLGFLNSLRGSYEDAVGDKGSTGDLSSSSQKDSEKRKKSKKRGKYSGVDKAAKQAAAKSTSVAPTTEGMSDSKEYPKPSGRMDSLTRFHNSKRKKPASVTETSSGSASQPSTEQSSSSLKDSDSKSDKTEQNSSSSDEYDNEDAVKQERSKGPPRKRLKGFHKANEFTRENLLEHSKRMDIEAEESGSGSED